jgi:hypothetical protein
MWFKISGHPWSQLVPGVAARSSRDQEMRADTCVIVSYYDERPSIELVKLLRQLRDVNAGADFELRVVINSDRGGRLQLPVDLASIPTTVRQNTGFNIGAWDHGWRQNREFSFYVFLQDECEIARENWLKRYKQLLSDGSVGVVGESLLYWSNWDDFKRQWPEATDECISLGMKRSIALGKAPTHLQTLAIGATASCLDRTDGLLVAEGKTRAIATEIMYSRQCLELGFAIKQSAWRPFEYIRHPQWASLRTDSSKLTWHISRAFRSLGRP